MPWSFHAGGAAEAAVGFSKAMRFCQGREVTAAAVTAAPTNLRLEILDCLVMGASWCCDARFLRLRTRVLCQLDQLGQNIAELRVVWPAKGKIRLFVKGVERVVRFLCGRLRREDGVAGADFILGFFDGFEGARGEEREDGGTKADDAFCGNQDRPAEDVGVDLIEHLVFLRDAAGVDGALDGYAIFRHAVEDDAGVEGCALDGGEEFVLRSALQIPTEGDAAQIGIDEDGAVAVIPGDAEKSGLPSAIIFQALAERGNVCTCAGGDGAENVTDGGEARFNSGTKRVNAAVHDTAHSGNEIDGRGDADDAGGSADDVDHVICTAACTDGVPVRVEGTDGNGNTGFESQLFGPMRGEMACDVIGGDVFALEFCADTFEERINFYEKFFGRKPAEVGVPEPLVTHGADATFYLTGIGDAAESSGGHVAMLEGRDKFFAFVWIMTEPMQKFGEAPFGGVDAAAPLDGLKIFAVCSVCDFRGFVFRAVIAPEVVLIEG